MKIEITGTGIFGADGEIPVGTTMDVKDEPKGWDGRYRVISGGEKATDADTGVTEKTAVTNPKKPKEDDGTLKAKHHAGGKFNVIEGDTIHLKGLSKVDADAFNEMSEEDKRAYVEATKQG